MTTPVMWERLDDCWQLLLAAGSGQEYPAKVRHWDLTVNLGSDAGGPVLHWVRIWDLPGAKVEERASFAPTLEVAAGRLDARRRGEGDLEPVREIVLRADGVEVGKVTLLGDEASQRIAGVEVSGDLAERTRLALDLPVEE